MTSSIKQNAGFAICVLLTVSLVGCISSITEEQLGNVGDPEVKEKGEKIFIVDHTGKKWDVTHAVEKYGFDPTQFEFGLGPNAIPPIIDPGMLSPGDPNYPDEGGTFVVIGTT
ncbi:MAG: hypothetical protein JSW58_13635, partial [Candidatus Latescibacterota bacterium]